MNRANPVNKKEFYLECEKHWVYWLLIAVGGYYGAYTYTVRGGIFCNAQTANVVLLSMALGTKRWLDAAYLLIPISSYFLGTIIAEILGRRGKAPGHLRWDTILVGVEIPTVIILGALPASAPDQICQVTLNFLCAMVFNTFRSNQGVPMATTFVTNHIRQSGRNIIISALDRDEGASLRWKIHLSMILMFLLGGIIAAIVSEYVGVRSIWGTVPILLYVFIKLVIADRTYEDDIATKG